MTKKPYVRFFNADSLGRTMSFFMGDEALAADLPFGAFSPFTEVPVGTDTFTVSCVNCDSAGKIMLTFGDSSVYTVAAVCIDDSVSLYGIREIFDQTNRSFAHLRICNLSPDIINADVFANNSQILGGVDYLEISRYIDMIPDTYNFTVRGCGSDKVLLNCGRQTVRSGRYNTLYFIGRVNSNPSVRCVFSVDAQSYDGEYL